MASLTRSASYKLSAADTTTTATSAASSSKHAGLLPGPANPSQPLPPPSSRPSVPTLASSGGVASVVSASKHQPPGSGSQVLSSTGAVRRLFGSQQSNPGQNPSILSLLGPQPSAYPPLVNPSTTVSTSHNPITSKPSTSQAVKQSIYPAKSSISSSSSSSSSGGNTKQHTQPNAGFRGKGADATPFLGQNVPPSTSTAKEKHVQAMAKMPSQQTMYSSVTSTGGAVAPQESVGEVIEQPMQQIMKTPMIFHESATQLTKPKKKSTYSDAVGKKNEVVAPVGNQGGQLGGIGTHSQPPPPSSAVPTGPQPPLNQHKLNLAPGTRPVGMPNNTEKVRRSFHCWQDDNFFLVFCLGP